MVRERFILHFNVADFAVAVERVCDMLLRRRPLIIAPLQSARAVVYDMSEEAFQNGVRKGMPLFQAKRICREAVVLPPRVELYRRAMDDCRKRVRRFSPLVENGIADGHLFVDITGTHRLFGPPPDIGWKVRKEVSNDLGINPIWTLSPNKLVAKVASRLVKPVGEYIVAAGEEQEFLAPLPVSLLPGVHPREMRRLQELNIFKIGQLAGFSRQELMVPFGSRGDFFYETSRGVDFTEVVCGVQQASSLSHEHHFGDDTNDLRQVQQVAGELAAKAGSELRCNGQEARRVGLAITYSDGTTVTRQASRRVGSSSDFVLRDLALLVLKRAWRRRTRLRSIRLICDRMHRRSPQLSLFSLAPEKKEQDKILGAMDTIRHRFGENSIHLGCH
jgi:DNA polymerase IV